jgi:hypothetical protein
VELDRCNGSLGDSLPAFPVESERSRPAFDCQLWELHRYTGSLLAAGLCFAFVYRYPTKSTGTPVDRSSAAASVAMAPPRECPVTMILLSGNLACES